MGPCVQPLLRGRTISCQGLYILPRVTLIQGVKVTHFINTVLLLYPPTQVDYAPEALENATECFLEMLDMEKVVRMGAEDQQDDLDLDEEEDDIGDETLETREEYRNK